jgi:hypothetical protein
MRHVAVFAAVMFSACAAATAEPPVSDEPDKRFERDMMVRFHMHQNFDLLRGIERLLIRGKLDEAKRFAEAIAIAPDEPAHGPWAAYTIAVRDQAAAVARARSVEEGLRLEARLAAACASCHREHHGSAIFEHPPKRPPDEPGIEARMARHRWAADRLWEAVVGDADDAWREGLDVLATAPPLPLEGERGRLGRELRRLAQGALKLKPPLDEPARRAALYGDILVTCAACHAGTK